MKRILISGYYGYSNSGDDAILSSILDDIRSLGGGYEVTILANNPHKVSDEYQVRAVDRFKVSAILKAMKACDIFMLGGGTLLQDDSSSRSLYYYVGLLWLAQRMKKRTMLYANGIGQLRKGFNSWLTGRVVNHTDIITLRESLSGRNLQHLNIIKPKILVTADPVFNLRLSPDLTKALLPEPLRESRKPLAAVAFRLWQDDSSYIPVMAAVCDKLITAYGMEVMFIPMNPSDQEVSSKILSTMKQKAYLLKSNMSVQEIIQVIGSCSLMLGMRLHAIIYAAIKNVPMIGFSYNAKVDYYIETLQMPVIKDIFHISETEVMDYVADIFENRETYKENLVQKVADLKRLADENVRLLEGL